MTLFYSIRDIRSQPTDNATYGLFRYPLAQMVPAVVLPHA